MLHLINEQVAEGAAKFIDESLPGFTKENIMAGIRVRIRDSQGVDAGGIARAFSSHVNAAFSMWKNDDGDSMFTSGGPANQYLLPSVLHTVQNPESSIFWTSFGKWLKLVLHHDLTFPGILHVALIKYLFLEDISVNDVVSYLPSLSEAFIGNSISEGSQLRSLCIDNDIIPSKYLQRYPDDEPTAIAKLKCALAHSILIKPRLFSLQCIANGFALFPVFNRVLNATEFMKTCMTSCNSVTSFMNSCGGLSGTSSSSSADVAFIEHFKVRLAVVLERLSPEQLGQFMAFVTGSPVPPYDSQITFNVVRSDSILCGHTCALTMDVSRPRYGGHDTDVCVGVLYDDIVNKCLPSNGENGLSFQIS